MRHDQVDLRNATIYLGDYGRGQPREATYWKCRWLGDSPAKSGTLQMDVSKECTLHSMSGEAVFAGLLLSAESSDNHQARPGAMEALPCVDGGLRISEYCPMDLQTP